MFMERRTGVEPALQRVEASSVCLSCHLRIYQSTDTLEKCYSSSFISNSDSIYASCSFVITIAFIRLSHRTESNPSRYCFIFCILRAVSLTANCTVSHIFQKLNDIPTILYFYGRVHIQAHIAKFVLYIWTLPKKSLDCTLFHIQLAFWISYLFPSRAI